MGITGILRVPHSYGDEGGGNAAGTVSDIAVMGLLISVTR